MLTHDGHAVTVDLASGKARDKAVDGRAGGRLADGSWAVRSDEKDEVRLGAAPSKGTRIRVDEGSYGLVVSGDLLWTLDAKGRLSRREQGKWHSTFEPDSGEMSPGPAGGLFLKGHSGSTMYVGPDGKARWTIQIPGPQGQTTWSAKQLWVSGGRIVLVDPETGTERLQLVLGAPGFAGPMALSPDGTTLAVAQTWETGDRVFLVDTARLESR